MKQYNQEQSLGHIQACPSPISSFFQVAQRYWRR